MKKSLWFIAKLVPVLALLSCATTQTKVSSTWKSPGFSGTVQKVLVVGIAKDPAMRKQFENDFTATLKEHNVTAEPSYTIFPDKIPDKDTLKSAISKDAIDTVLITRVVSNKDVKTYVPGTDGTYGNYWGFYGSAWDYAYSPGYSVVNKTVVLETNLYSVADEKLVWTATSDTTSEGSNTDIIKSFIGTMTGKMQQDGLVK